MIDIYIFCHNEEIMISHTIKHYRDRLPNASITICDNFSDDKSVEIAISLGCQVFMWKYNKNTFEFDLTKTKNTVWKEKSKGWVIVCDMDEWLCVTENDLNKEEKKNTSILTVEGWNVSGDAKNLDLSDINLHNLCTSNRFWPEDKNLCFNSKLINDINYDNGCHFSSPKGLIKYSEEIYFNKHVFWPGLIFIFEKYKKRYVRTFEMRKLGMATHYTDNEEELKKKHNDLIKLPENKFLCFL